MKSGPLSRPRAGQITDVSGIEVGHAQDPDALTGCTVVLCGKGAVAGVDVRGGAPGSRETDLLNPINLVQRVHAVLLTGGPAFGLEAAGGVVRYLEERNIGFDAGMARVPIVPAAVLFDLNLGNGRIRPDSEMGYRACTGAARGPVREGTWGAGAGASVGKLFGSALAMKSGLGTASLKVGGTVVGAIVAVNAFGDVLDVRNGQIVAGLRSGRLGRIRVGGGARFADTVSMMNTALGLRALRVASNVNTVIGVVATDAALSKAQATKVAQMAHDGLARAIRPAHTMFDGDTIFALSTGRKPADISTLGAFAAEVMANAILRAVKSAASAGGLPGLKHN